MARFKRLDLEYLEKLKENCALNARGVSRLN